MDLYGFVEFIQSGAAWLAVWRMVDLKLVKRFPALFGWLCVLGTSNLVAGLLSHFSGAYFWFYVIYVPLTCLFSVLAVRELFALVFIDYPGIRSVGRWSMYAGVALATAASLLVAGVFRRTRTGGSRHLLYLEVSERSIVFSLVIVIATILFFLSRYPLHLGKNTYVSSALFSALFLSQAATLLIDSMQSQLYSIAVDRAGAGFIVICLIAWATLLKPDTPSDPDKINFTTVKEEHLIEQLEALNEMLGGTVRR